MNQFLAVYNSRTLTLTAPDPRMAQREAARRFRARHRHQVSIVRVAGFGHEVSGS